MQEPLSEESAKEAEQRNRDNALICYAEASTDITALKKGRGHCHGISSSLKRKGGVAGAASPTAAGGGGEATFGEKAAAKEERRFLAKVFVFTLGNAQKRVALPHVFDEPFTFVQLHARERENIASCLAQNRKEESLFFLWNFRKDLLLCSLEFRQRISRFAPHPRKSDLVLFVGPRYVRFFEANFTNRSIKDAGVSVLPMKVEKENEFIDVDFVPGADAFVLVSSSNCAFYVEDMKLRHSITGLNPNYEKAEGLRSDSFDKRDHDSPLAAAAPHAREEAKEEENEEAREEPKAAKGSWQARISDAVSRIAETQSRFFKKKEFEFETVCATRKGFYVGTKGGFLLVFEFWREDEGRPHYMSSVQLSERIVSVKSLALNAVGDMIALTAVYPYKIREKGEPSEDMLLRQAAEGRGAEAEEGGRTGGPSFLFTQQRDGGVTLKEYEYEERAELMVVNVKALQATSMQTMVTKIFNKGTHDGAVLGLAACKNRSLFASLAGKRLA